MPPLPSENPSLLGARDTLHPRPARRAAPAAARRLHRNHGGYRGETIDIRAVLAATAAAAQRLGWRAETFHRTPDFSWVAWHRGPRSPTADRPPLRLYFSAGIHGDEPAGPLALLRLVEQDAWPRGVELWVVPCLNPTGFVLHRRENAAGADLNRDYRHLTTPEVRAHTAWLTHQPDFTTTFCLHEDWEAQGFYLYELNPEERPSLAARMIAAVEEVCPIDHSPVIESRPAVGGVIRPSLDPATRPQWPEAFYLLQHKTRLSYTLEAPSDFPLEVRVEALTAGLGAALAALPA